MSQASAEGRLALKTPEAAFLRVLTEEFGFSSRVSRELLQVGQEMLAGGVSALAVRPGQVRLVVASFQAPFGPPLQPSRTLTKRMIRGYVDWISRWTTP